VEPAGGGSSIALNFVAQQPPTVISAGRSTSTLVLREGGNNRATTPSRHRSVSVVATTSTSIAVHPSLR